MESFKKCDECICHNCNIDPIECDNCVFCDTHSPQSTCTNGNFTEAEKVSKIYKSNINHPDYYLGTRQYEPIDVILDWNLGFCLGNALKYISRAGRKDKNKTVEDLRKAVWYIEHEIQQYD